MGTFSYNTEPKCFPFTTSFKANAKNTVEYLWDFSNGDTKTTQAASTTYQYEPGFYVPKMILSDAYGCKVPVKGLDTIKIFDVKAKASIANTLLCDSTKIILKDSSISNDTVTNEKWLFSDNSTSTQNTVIKYYTQQATYPFTLISFTKHGCTDTLQSSYTVKVQQSPQINIAGTNAACAPASLNFSASGRPQDTALAWNWNFGNGITANVQNPTAIVYKKCRHVQYCINGCNYRRL